MRNYIGLSCSLHDPALAIVDSAGRVVFAEATERQLQDKRAFNNPPDGANRVHRLIERYAEPGAQLVLARTWTPGNQDKDVHILQLFDRVERERAGENRAPWNSEDRDELARWGLNTDDLCGEGVGYLLAFYRCLATSAIQSIAQAGLNLQYRVRESSPDWAGDLIVRNHDHHTTHAATACYTSPFDNALCAIMDGSGEDIANTFFRYRNGRLEHIPTPEGRGLGSLGFFYWHLGWACGFDPFKGEEWKVMGLAPYGRFDQALYDLMRPMLDCRGLALKLAPDYAARLGQLLRLRRPQQEPMAAADLAHTGQQVFADVSVEMLRTLHQLGGSDNLVLSGGCALNSAWNGRILQETPFSQMHVFSAPADDGNAIGAALLSYQQDHPDERRPPKCQSPYLGQEMDPGALSRAVSLGGLRSTLPPGADICRRTAEILARGKCVGWVQGRAEFGPRALGNRSILADPRDPGMKDRLNARVKFREAFRPFAPSILHEHGADYFEDYCESPYMERALRFRESVRHLVPAVVHVNGTGRLQSVRREWNPRYHDLIACFYELTGVPLLLNTSFNIMGKPIIHSVEDAVAVFFTTGLDALVIGDRLFEK